MKSSTDKFLRIFLGLFLILYALNQFFHFLPTSYGQMPESAMDFIDSIIMYLPLLYGFEVLIGIFLILDRWTSLILIVLIPLSFAFLFFSLINGDFAELWPAVLVALINAWLVADRKEKYLPLLER